MKLKDLRAKLTRLQQAAAAKVALITDTTSEVDARKIETEHADMLKEITAVEKVIARAVKEVDSEDDDEVDENTGEKRRRGGAKDEATDDEDNKKGRALMAEMALVDSQARSLGVELNLPEAITKGEKPDDMRKRMFAELAKKAAEKGPNGSTGGGDLQIGRDERDGVSGAMEVALTMRMLASRGRDGIEYKPKDIREAAFFAKHKEQARNYMTMGLIDIAAACIDYKPNRGAKYLTAADANIIFERAFNTTSDFPAIFQNVLNKSLLARYELRQPTYREIAAERPFHDFRPHPQIRAGEFPQLQPVPETGELKYGSSADNGETISVVPYGVVFSISRQMLVNDDLGAIDQILGSAGDTVLVFENTTFFAMFNSNPVLLQDGLAVFHATHNNLASPGADPAVATVSTARTAFRGQKSISGLYLNVPPAILLTGPIEETAADLLVTSITPVQVSQVNPFSGKLRIVVDSNITDKSWYIFAEPGRVPNFVYGFLNGATGPRVRTFEPFGVQGVKISLEHDFGCGAVDFRGGFRSPTF